MKIHESKKRVFTETVHESFEGLGGVIDTKRYLEKLPQAKISHYCHFCYVVSCHRNRIVTMHEVHFGEYLFACKCCIEIPYV